MDGEFLKPDHDVPQIDVDENGDPIERPPQSHLLPGTKLQFALAKAKVDYLLKNATRVGDCLLCHLIPVAKGYCYVSIGRENRLRAHRLVHLIVNNGDPNLFALHSCDIRRCIEPNHLFSGTAQDNTNDMISKGRKVDDPDVGKRRREATAKLIKTLRDKGYSDARIKAEYGISNSTFWNYTRGPYRESLAVLTRD